MIKRRPSVMAITVVAVLASFLSASVSAQQKLPVVATFSILGDMVQRIGGDTVAVTTLVGRDGDAHVYQPTPADAKAVKQAALLITNGLDFEGWLDRLAQAAEFNGELVVTSNGIKTLSFDDHAQHEGHEGHEGHERHEGNGDGDTSHSNHADHKDHKDHKDHRGHDDHVAEKAPHYDHSAHEHHHGDLDPHGWQSLQNAVVYVDNITDALAKAAPADASVYYQNRAAYVAEIEALDQQIRAMVAALPDDARTIVTSHDAFQYFGRDYQLRFLAPQGLSTESEASARDVAQLIKLIRKENIYAVFVEGVADPRLVQQIASETGSVVGGKLYPGSLSDPGGPAGTYLDMMRHNAQTIVTALSGAKRP